MADRKVLALPAVGAFGGFGGVGHDKEEGAIESFARDEKKPANHAGVQVLASQALRLNLAAV